MNRKLQELFGTPERFRNTVATFALVLGIFGFCMAMIGLFFMKR